MMRVGFGVVGLRHTARSLGADIVISKRRAKAHIRAALCSSPASEEESETRSSAYPRSQTVAEASRTVDIWKWREGSSRVLAVRCRRRPSRREGLRRPSGGCPICARRYPGVQRWKYPGLTPDIRHSSRLPTPTEI